jgi:hypothetical protein
MNKKIIITLLSIFLLGEIIAQSENRVVADFQALKVSNALEVILTQGEENNITITGIQTEDQDKLKTEVNDGMLSVYTKGKIIKRDNIKVLITFKHLTRIEQSGTSEITSTNPIKEDSFSISGSGATEINLAVETNSLTIDFSGASDITLSGTTDNLDAKLSGASDLKAAKLIAKNVNVDISGASDVKVYASESISGKASGASSINVKGSPTVRAIQSSGASDTSFNGKKVEVSVSDIFDEAEIVNDTTRIKWGNTKILLINDSISKKKYAKKRRNHWAGIDLGINGFLNANNSFDLSNEPSLELTNPKEVTQFMELNYSKSWTVSINFMEFFTKIKGHHFGIVTGLGTEWNNYELKHNVSLNSEGGNYVYPIVDEFNKDYTWGEIDTLFEYSKNRFKTWFINAPFLLELNTGNNKNKSFHISAGAIVGYNLQTKMKYIYKDNGDEKKEKDKQSFNTNPFRVSLTTRVGVGRFNVFVTYSLTPLFENNRGPELYPFTVGVSLLGF